MPNPHRKGITVPQSVWDSWQDYADAHGYSSRSAVIRAAVERLMTGGYDRLEALEAENERLKKDLAALDRDFWQFRQVGSA